MCQKSGTPLAIAVVRPDHAVKSRYVQTDERVFPFEEADFEIQGPFSLGAYTSEERDDPVSDFEFERRMSNDDAVDLDEASGRLRGRMGGERDQSDDLEELSEFHVSGLLQVLSEYECKGYS